MSIQKDSINLLDPEKEPIDGYFTLSDSNIYKLGIELMIKSFVEIIFKHKNKELLAKTVRMTQTEQSQALLRV